MKIIGVTGSIASGKSTVTALLKEKGAFIIDADVIAREVVEPGRPAWAEVVERFGESILEADRSINRRELGRIVFADKGKRLELNAIVHPRVMEEVEARLRALEERGGDAVVILDVPLLFEVGMDKRCALTIAVTAGREMRMARLMAQGLSRDEAESRIDAQRDKEALQGFADVVIVNEGTLDELRREVDAVWKRILAGDR